MRNTNPRLRAAEAKRNIFSAKTIFIPLLLLLMAGGSPRRMHAQIGSDEAKDSAHALKLWGTPGEARLLAADPKVKIQAAVNVIAENTGKENLFLLRRAPASNAEEIVSVANPTVAVWRQEHQAAAQSNSDPAFPKLRRALDQQEPPDDDVITLGPGDSIGWNVVVELDIPKGDGPGNFDAIRKSCPCAIKLDLDLWPLALEPSGDRTDSGFGKKVSKHWRKKGTLVFTTKQTDPIEIKLPEK